MLFSGRAGPSGFSACSTAEEVTQGIDASAHTAIVTVRNVESCKKVKETIIKELPEAKIDIMELDLASLASVRKFASEYNSLGLPLNLLINNAGVMFTPFMLSQDNIEMQFATNHLGHFLLTNLLSENMKKTARESGKEGKIVNVSSWGHHHVYPEGIRSDKINDSSSYSSTRAYGQSKLANILHANELSRRFQEEGVNITANSLHPGAIATNLFRYHSGAATTCYVALHPKVGGASGKYFEDSNIAQPSELSADADLAKKLWDLSLKMSEA